MNYRASTEAKTNKVLTWYFGPGDQVRSSNPVYNLLDSDRAKWTIIIVGVTDTHSTVTTRYLELSEFIRNDLQLDANKRKSKSAFKAFKEKITFWLLTQSELERENWTFKKENIDLKRKLKIAVASAQDQLLDMPQLQLNQNYLKKRTDILMYKRNSRQGFETKVNCAMNLVLTLVRNLSGKDPVFTDEESSWSRQITKLYNAKSHKIPKGHNWNKDEFPWSCWRRVQENNDRHAENFQDGATTLEDSRVLHSTLH